MTLPDIPARLIMPPSSRMTADQFYDFCQSNPDLWIELTKEGDVVIMPPAGPESSYRGLEVSYALRGWAGANRQGTAFDSSGAFALPDGSVMAPDAAWVASDRLNRFTKAQKQKCLPLAPDFIVEVMSPSDRLPQLQSKMEDWLRNGVQLGWLIDADNRTVYIYRPGQPVEELRDAAEIAADGPVAGFVLPTKRLREGL